MQMNLSNWWGGQTAIATCVRCGRYTEDPNKDADGKTMHENPEEDLEVVCSECHKTAFNEALTEEMGQFVEEWLGLSEEKRATLKKVVEMAVTEPDKFLELRDLSNRVRSLERQNSHLWIAISVAVALLAIVAAIALYALAS